MGMSLVITMGKLEKKMCYYIFQELLLTSRYFFSISVRTPDASAANWRGFQTRELNNGRLAMFGIMGELAHSAITGKGPIELFEAAHKF